LLDSDEEDERERERIPKGSLGPKAKHRLEVMLRKLTFERGAIAKTMAFAIDHSDAADEVLYKFLKFFRNIFTVFINIEIFLRLLKLYARLSLSKKLLYLLKSHDYI
jgi:hypothetical protein